MKNLLKILKISAERKEDRCPYTQRCSEYKQYVRDNKMLKGTDEYGLCHNPHKFVYCPNYNKIKSEEDARIAKP